MVRESNESPVRRWYSILVSRWYVVVIWGAVLGVGLSLTATAVPSQFQADGQVLLLPPAQPVSEGQRRNPYLSLPDGLTLTSILVANSVSTLDVRRELAEAGYTSTFAVGVVPGTGPLVAVTVRDSEAAVALELRDDLIERVEAELDRLQSAEGVIDDQLMEARRFNVSSKAEELTGSRIRAIAAMVLLALVMAILSVSLLERRRRPSRSSQPPGPLDSLGAELSDDERFGLGAVRPTVGSAP